MCACGTSPYAMDLVARLQAAAPSAVIHRHFLGPHQLAEVRCKVWDMCWVLAPPSEPDTIAPRVLTVLLSSFCLSKHFVPVFSVNIR